MPVKIIFLIAVFFVSVCNASEKVAVENFSENIKVLISSEDRVGFGKLPVYPEEIISQDAISYVFGGTDNSGFVVFSNGNKLSTGIYGPYARKDADGYPVYSIVFYDPKVIAKDQKGYFDSDQIREHWGTAFVETVVVVVDNRVMFHRTPFYYGSHAPWAKDY